MGGRYCAYLRKSRADEVREKVEMGYDALAHHRRALEDLAFRMGVEVARWYSDEIKSGDSIADRPQMSELLRDVADGAWDGVLCMEVERLTRGDMVDQGTVGRAFSESGTLIVTPLKVYDPASEADMEYFEFGLFMSRREYKAINKRLQAGKLAAVRDGQFIGCCAPYGFDKADVDGKHTLVPNGDAKYVRFVFERYAAGDSYAKIARQLDAMGARPMRSEKWHYASVAHILRNEAYIGKTFWKKTTQRPYRENGRTRYRCTVFEDPLVVDALHEAIVPMELWEAARRRRDASPARKEYSPRNYYGRILRCADCGKALHYCGTGNVKTPLMTHITRGEQCPTKGCRLSVLDDVFVEALEGICADIEIEARPECDSARDAYMRAIAQAEATIEANFDRMERGVISEEDFVVRRKVLEGRIADAQEALDALPEVSDGQRAVTIRECIRAIRNPDVSVESKRLLIWSIVDHIDYTNHARQGEDDIHLEIYLR